MPRFLSPAREESRPDPEFFFWVRTRLRGDRSAEGVSTSPRRLERVRIDELPGSEPSLSSRTRRLLKSPLGGLRVEVAGDDLVDLVDGRKSLFSSYLAGHVKIEASLSDLLRLRKLA